MLMLGVRPAGASTKESSTSTAGQPAPLTYSIKPSDIATYFPNRQAHILLHPSAGQPPRVVGSFGIVHPEVLDNFGVTGQIVASVLEIYVEPFL